MLIKITNRYGIMVVEIKIQGIARRTCQFIIAALYNLMTLCNTYFKMKYNRKQILSKPFDLVVKLRLKYKAAITMFSLCKCNNPENVKNANNDSEYGALINTEAGHTQNNKAALYAIALFLVVSKPRSNNTSAVLTKKNVLTTHDDTSSTFEYCKINCKGINNEFAMNLTLIGNNGKNANVFSNVYPC